MPGAIHTESSRRPKRCELVLCPFHRCRQRPKRVITFQQVTQQTFTKCYFALGLHTPTCGHFSINAYEIKLKVAFFSLKGLRATWTRSYWAGRHRCRALLPVWKVLLDGAVQVSADTAMSKPLPLVSLQSSGEKTVTDKEISICQLTY